jgi:hypothetical protein
MQGREKTGTDMPKTVLLLEHSVLGERGDVDEKKEMEAGWSLERIAGKVRKVLERGGALLFIHPDRVVDRSCFHLEHCLRKRSPDFFVFIPVDVVKA